MWKNLLKVAFRNLWKQKTFSLINVLGLALGMACCFLIIQFVRYESNYDRFHPNKDRIYRIGYHLNFANEINIARIPPTVGPLLMNHFPEIEAASRMYRRDLSVRVPETDKQFELDEVYFSDSLTQEIFGMEYLHGDPETALDRPFSVVLTDQMAEMLFGEVDVLGKTLELAGENNFTITGIVKKWPEQAHLQFNMLIPFDNMVDVEPEHARGVMQEVLRTNWVASHSYTYVLLKPNASPEAIEEKFPGFVQKFGDERFKDKQRFSLMPVADIHLHSNLGSEPIPQADQDMLFLFIGIGIITLLIACINFVNLSTASSLTRAKEVGVRKVLGAQKGNLIGQFLGESLLLSFIAFLLSVLLAKWAMPLLNSLTGLEMVFEPWNNVGALAIFLGIFLLAGIIAGSYPAFFVSRFRAITAMKGNTSKSTKPGGAILRKGLITLQFLVAITFISSAVIVLMQLNFLRNQPMGFDQELNVFIPLNSENNLNAVFRPGDATLRGRMNSFDEIVQNHPNILAVTQCSRMPGMGAVGRNITTDSLPASENFTSSVVAVDYDYVETLGLEIIAGRDFGLSYGTDHTSSFILNEQAVKEMKWESPEAALGQKITIELKVGQVVGVLKDFHYRSLRTEIDPLILEVRPGAFAYFGIQLSNKEVPETLAFLEEKWTEYFPGKVFEYAFLDESISDIYQSEERFSQMIGYFAFIAIFISCFGLFGLAALLTQHRFKEIGIRKILGASVQQILSILASDFLKLIALSMVLALPLCWYFVDAWMEDFAYHIAFPWWVPFTIGVLVVLVGFLTISSQTIKAALADPVESLRYE